MDQPQSDRELLELAAKAAGLDLATWDEDRGVMNYPFRSDLTDCHMWNPLTDDGDALRLALLTGTNVFRGMAENRTGRHFATAAEVAADLCAATRRAIVRAAAEIARSK